MWVGNVRDCVVSPLMQEEGFYGNLDRTPLTILSSAMRSLITDKLGPLLKLLSKGPLLYSVVTPGTPVIWFCRKTAPYWATNIRSPIHVLTKPAPAWLQQFAMRWVQSSIIGMCFVSNKTAEIHQFRFTQAVGWSAVSRSPAEMLMCSFALRE